MGKLNPDHLFKRGYFDPLTVCEQPLTEPCNANETRIGCVLQNCCFFMDACYKKTLPGYIKAFYSLIIIVLILFCGALGYLFYKYRKEKKKYADIDEVEEYPAETDTSSISQEEQEQDGTNQMEVSNDETGIDGACSTSEIERKHDNLKAAELTIGLLSKERIDEANETVNPIK